MVDGYKEFDDAEWKIGGTDGGGGGDNKYVDLTLNKANGGATNGASATHPEINGAPGEVPQNIAGNASPPPKVAPSLADPYGPPSDSSDRHLVGDAGSDKGGGLWTRHWRLIFAVVLVVLIVAVALGAGLGVGLSSSSSSSTPPSDGMSPQPPPAPAPKLPVASPPVPSSATGADVNPAAAVGSAEGKKLPDVSGVGK